MTADRDVNILMYHSVANGRGPLATAPDTFRRHLDTLAEDGFHGASVRDYITRLDAGAAVNQLVVLTFDDGYGDFSDVVVPELELRGWSCTVYLAPGLLGRSWNPDGSGDRRLIDWSQAKELSPRRVEIGAHGISHVDLTRIGLNQARHEIADSKLALEDRLQIPVTSFAPPYGHTTPTIRDIIAQSYTCAVGTRLARATPASDRYDLPRIDMWYFRNYARWRAYLDGATRYFTVRQILRNVRMSAGLGAVTR